MSDYKKDTKAPVEPGGINADDRAALLRQLHEEMGSMTPEELERLYAIIALMELNQDD